MILYYCYIIIMIYWATVNLRLKKLDYESYRAINSPIFARFMEAPGLQTPRRIYGIFGVYF